MHRITLSVEDTGIQLRGVLGVGNLRIMATDSVWEACLGATTAQFPVELQETTILA
jgi:hypothetical protein